MYHNTIDVLKIAHAIAKHSLKMVSDGQSNFLLCIYCGKELHDIEHSDLLFKHYEECQVLTAYDIIKGNK